MISRGKNTVKPHTKIIYEFIYHQLHVKTSDNNAIFGFFLTVPRGSCTRFYIIMHDDIPI